MLFPVLKIYWGQSSTICSHTQTYTHTRKHTHRHKHTGIIKSNDKNSLQAYFIWRFPHILVILFRAVDKIGSDISLLMPFTICRLTTSLFPSYPFSLSLPPSSLSQLQHLVSLTPSHNRSSPPHPSTRCVSLLLLNLPSILSFFFLAYFRTSCSHLQSPFHAFIHLHTHFPNASSPCFALWHLSTHHLLPSSFAHSSLSPLPLHLKLSTFFTTSLTLYILPTLPPGLVTINRASRGFHNGLLYLTLLQRHYWPYFSLLLSFVMHTQ